MPLDMNRPAAPLGGSTLHGGLGRERTESGTLDSCLTWCLPQQIRGFAFARDLGRVCGGLMLPDPCQDRGFHEFIQSQDHNRRHEPDTEHSLHRASGQRGCRMGIRIIPGLQHRSLGWAPQADLEVGCRSGARISFRSSPNV